MTRPWPWPVPASSSSVASKELFSQSVEHASLDFNVVSSSPMWGVQTTLNNFFLIKKNKARFSWGGWLAHEFKPHIRLKKKVLKKKKRSFLTIVALTLPEDPWTPCFWLPSVTRLENQDILLKTLLTFAAPSVFIMKIQTQMPYVPGCVLHLQARAPPLVVQEL